MRRHMADNWTVSELFLDLLQDKLLHFQRFYDLSVDERAALRDSEPAELATILQAKSELQQQINRLDHEIGRLSKKHPNFVANMDTEQNREFRSTIELIVDLLQNIIDYESTNREIAQTQKDQIQHQLNRLSGGNKLLQTYFKKSAADARFIDKSH